MNPSPANAAHRLPRGFLRPGRLLATLGLLTQLTSVQGAEVSPSAALEAYRKGDYQDSQAQYSQLAKQNPEDARLRFNAGAAAYRLNDLTNAATWFESVLGNPDLRLQQQAYYNLGNARFRLGESLPDAEARRRLWSEALTNFVSAMKLDAADTNASANYAFVRQQLEQLERQMPPPQQQPNPQQQQQDKKDQQKKDEQQQQQSSQEDQEQNAGQDSQDNKSPSEQNQRQDPSQGQQPQDSNQGSQGQNPPEDKPEASKDPGSKDPESSDQKPGAESKGSQPGQGQQGGEEGHGVEAAEAKGEMTAAQAVQMLESQKGEEKALLLRAYGNAKEAAERAARIRKPW